MTQKYIISSISFGSISLAQDLNKSIILSCNLNCDKTNTQPKKNLSLKKQTNSTFFFYTKKSKKKSDQKTLTSSVTNVQIKNQFMNRQIQLYLTMSVIVPLRKSCSPESIVTVITN